jgi:hypothetical protein
MVARMKTTIDIADALFQEAKVIAASEGSTLRNLVEEGLRLALARHEGSELFKLRDASFPGNGLRPDVTLERWDGVHGFSHGGHEG